MNRASEEQPPMRKDSFSAEAFSTIESDLNLHPWRILDHQLCAGSIKPYGNCNHSDQAEIICEDVSTSQPFLDSKHSCSLWVEGFLNRQTQADDLAWSLEARFENNSIQGSPGRGWSCKYNQMYEVEQQIFSQSLLSGEEEQHYEVIYSQNYALRPIIINIEEIIARKESQRSQAILAVEQESYQQFEQDKIQGQVFEKYEAEPQSLKGQNKKLEETSRRPIYRMSRKNQPRKRDGLTVQILNGSELITKDLRSDVTFKTIFRKIKNHYLSLFNQHVRLHSGNRNALHSGGICQSLASALFELFEGDIVETFNEGRISFNNYTLTIHSLIFTFGALILPKRMKAEYPIQFHSSIEQIESYTQFAPPKKLAQLKSLPGLQLLIKQYIERFSEETFLKDKSFQRHKVDYQYGLRFLYDHYCL